MKRGNQGYRRDLETLDGQRRAMLNGLKYGNGFTEAQRRKGHYTQRQQGRFGHGRFVHLPAPPVGTRGETTKDDDDDSVTR